MERSVSTKKTNAISDASWVRKKKPSLNDVGKYCQRYFHPVKGLMRTEFLYCCKKEILHAEMNGVSKFRDISQLICNDIS